MQQVGIPQLSSTETQILCTPSLQENDKGVFHLMVGLLSSLMQTSTPAPIALVAREDPHQAHTWSGIPANLAAALAAQGVATLPIQSQPVRLRRLVDYHALHLTLHMPPLCLVPSRLARAHESRVAAHRLECYPHVSRVIAMGDHLHPAHLPGRTVTLFVDQCMANIMHYARRHGFPGGYEIHARTWREQWAWQNSVFRQASLVFTASEWTRAAIIRQHGATPERVVTVGFGASIKPPSSAVPAPCREPGTLLFVGYEWERKGGPLLVDAFRTLRQAIPDARLIVAGCQPVLDEPGVTVLGPVGKEDLAILYARATLFVMPSLYEPFGIVYLEAMRYGLPVVALRRNAASEIVDDGVTGALCDADSPHALAALLRQLLDQPAILFTMSAAATENVARHWTWEAVARRMLAAFDARVPTADAALTRRSA